MADMEVKLQEMIRQNLEADKLVEVVNNEMNDRIDQTKEELELQERLRVNMGMGEEDLSN
jgi:hypothetical protein